MKAVGIAVPGALKGFDACYPGLGAIDLSGLLSKLNG